MNKLLMTAAIAMGFLFTGIANLHAQTPRANLFRQNLSRPVRPPRATSRDASRRDLRKSGGFVAEGLAELVRSWRHSFQNGRNPLGGSGPARTLRIDPSLTEAAENLRVAKESDNRFQARRRP